jgi:hypothetical protein
VGYMPHALFIQQLATQSYGTVRQTRFDEQINQTRRQRG